MYIKRRATRKILKGDIFFIFSVLYSTLLHLPHPSHSTVSDDAGKGWDQTKDSCNFDMAVGTLTNGLDLVNIRLSHPHSARSHPQLGLISSTTRLDLIHNSARSHLQSARSYPKTRLDLIHNSARSHP